MLYNDHLRSKRNHKVYYLFFKNNLNYYLESELIHDLINFSKSNHIKVSIFKNLSDDIINFINKKTNKIKNKNLIIQLISELDTSNLKNEQVISSISSKNVIRYYNSELRTLYYTLYNNLKMNNVNNSLINDNINSLITFTDLNFNYLNSRKINSYFTSLGKLAYLNNNINLTKKIFNSHYVFLKDSIHFNSSINNIFWSNMMQKQFKKNIDFLNKSKIDINTLNDKNLFTLAFTHLKLNNIEEAEKLFLNVINNNLLSYYSILSTKKLIEIDSNRKSDFISSNKSLKSIRVSSTSDLKLSLRRMKLWHSLNSDQFLTFEFKKLLKKNSIYSTSQTNKELIHLVSSFLIKNKKYISSFKVVHNFINKNSDQVSHNLLSNIFPKPYFKEILKYSKKFDPYIFLSLMRQESAFNPRARSHAGARGLMQLMPHTAKRIKRSIRIRDLYSPKKNISLGVKYLNKLIKKYDGNLIYTLAAYNAGENALQRWKRDIFNKNAFNFNDPFLQNYLLIESIPYKETRNYVKLIYRNIYFYKLLYSELVPSKEFHQLNDLNFISVL